MWTDLRNRLSNASGGKKLRISASGEAVFDGIEAMSVAIALGCDGLQYPSILDAVIAIDQCGGELFVNPAACHCANRDGGWIRCAGPDNRSGKAQGLVEVSDRYIECCIEY